MKKISLPGYFTKHFFIRAILEIFEDYREYFYDDIILDSSYDLPDGLIWNGGRVMTYYSDYMPKVLDQIMNFYKEKDFSLWHTCTNMMLQPEHLDDVDCHHFFDTYLKPNDKVVINSQMLLEYMKEKWDPEFVYSTTLGLRDIDKLNEISKNNIVCINYNDQLDDDYTSKLLYPKNVEIIAGEACHLNCPNRFRHYEAISLYTLGDRSPENERDIYCPNNIPSDKCGIEYVTLYDGFLPFEKMNELAEKGFEYFKIVGRERDDQPYLETIAYYIVKPEYRYKFVRKMMLRKTGFNLFGYD